jgi:exo-beta-1,3-glucanase (GH17 family)
LETIKLFYSTNKNPDENYWITLDYPIKIRKYKFDKSQLNTITKIESAMKLIIIITIFMGLYKYLKIN